LIEALRLDCATLQVNPVGFAYNPELKTVDIHGYRLANSRKFRNVDDDGRAAFTDQEPHAMTSHNRDFTERPASPV
jgi:hypothetical protein